MERVKIERISVLSRLSRERALTPEELAEQARLRGEYLEAIRANFRKTLDSIEFTDEKKERG